MTNVPSVIGIDLGGTAIKLGRFTKEGDCQEILTIPTPQPSTPEAVLEAIAAAVEQLRNDQCVAIGLGTPGPADPGGRIARIAINLSNWRDVPVADYLEATVSLPTAIANDANCAAVGEAWLGAGKNYRNLIMLTLGTGVGGAIILDGQLYTGFYGAAGELGLISINPDGPPCNSGNSGSLEQYLSIPAIRRLTGKEPVELGRLAEAGDTMAQTFWAEYGKTLGVGLANLIYVLTPEAIIIGGGISASSKFFLPAAQAEVHRRVLAIAQAGLAIVEAKLGNQAGMIGAAKLAWQKLC